jgi:FkbM family methyltransferase
MLLQRLDKVEKIATASKFERMLTNPFKYFNAIIFRDLIYKRKKVEKKVLGKTFFDTKIHLFLPSSTDIYLTGGKSHDSEIRLAKFLIKNLQSNDSFVDVGAHYGYFTLLGSKLVGSNGKVYSFEASPTTYRILYENTRDKSNIEALNLAVSDEASTLKFYEFPNLYSEYNTLNVEQFINENWYSEYKPKEITVKSIILDDFLSTKKIDPKIIKIDVEGAENKVIVGLKNYLSEHSPFIVMEYLSDQRGNEEHQKAENNLNSLGYTSFIIDKSGNLRKIDFISKYLEENNLESDNIVFSKKENAS